MGRPTNGPEILYIREARGWTANPRHMSKASKETQKLAKDIMDRRMPAVQRRLVWLPARRGPGVCVASARVLRASPCVGPVVGVAC